MSKRKPAKKPDPVLRLSRQVSKIADVFSARMDRIEKNHSDLRRLVASEAGKRIDTPEVIESVKELGEGLKWTSRSLNCFAKATTDKLIRLEQRIGNNEGFADRATKEIGNGWSEMNAIKSRLSALERPPVPKTDTCPVPIDASSAVSVPASSGKPVFHYHGRGPVSPCGCDLALVQNLDTRIAHKVTCPACLRAMWACGMTTPDAQPKPA